MMANNSVCVDIEITFFSSYHGIDISAEQFLRLESLDGTRSDSDTHKA